MPTATFLAHLVPKRVEWDTWGRAWSVRSFIPRSVEAVAHTEKTRAPPIQKTADRLAGHLVHFYLGCAGLEDTRIENGGELAHA